MLHVDYIYNNNNIYAFVLWLLSYFKFTPQQSLVTFVVSHLLLQHLSPLWGCCLSQSYSLIGGFFGCFAFAAFSSVACSISPVLRLCCSTALSVALFVCNLGCWMLRLFGCHMDSECCQSFQPLKTSEAASAFFWMVLDGLVCCLQWLSR